MTIEVNYKIKNFNEQTGAIIVEFENFGSFNIELPIDDNGFILSGDALNNYIKGFAPVGHYQRLNKLSKGIKNADEIKNLIEQNKEIVNQENENSSQDENDNFFTEEEEKAFIEVPYGATPQKIIDVALNMVDINENDVLFDIGAGDGRGAISAAKRGAKVVAIEKDPNMVDIMQNNIRKSGVEVEIKLESFLDSDLSDATIIYTFLTERMNSVIAFKWLQKLKKGTKIITFYWPISWLQPDNVEVYMGQPIFLYIVK